MITDAFIYEQAPFPSCHAVSIVDTKGGELLATWFGGTKEGAPDVAIWLSRSKLGSDRWSAPEKMSDERGVPCWNPVLFREAQTGDIYLFFKAGPSPREWSGFYRRSTDGGASFGDVFIMPAGLLGPIKNKPVQLSDGVILSPTSVESYKAWACWVERSTDGGRSWTRSGPIFHPEHPLGVIQPSILRRRNGSLFMLMRSTREIGQICQASSADGGVSWTPAAAVEDLPNPNSGIDAVTLSDGRHLLVYNPTHMGRTPLALAVSVDDGQTWKHAATLEDDPGEYSYPAAIQALDGSIHVAYTWRRQRIRHRALQLTDIPS